MRPVLVADPARVSPDPTPEINGSDLKKNLLNFVISILNHIIPAFYRNLKGSGHRIMCLPCVESRKDHLY